MGPAWLREEFLLGLPHSLLVSLAPCCFLATSFMSHTSTRDPKADCVLSPLKLWTTIDFFFLFPLTIDRVVKILILKILTTYEIDPRWQFIVHSSDVLKPPFVPSVKLLCALQRMPVIPMTSSSSVYSKRQLPSSSVRRIDELNVVTYTPEGPLLHTIFAFCNFF